MFGIVHPVPLAVQDVVADLHVLEDLRHRQPRCPEQPRRRVARGHQHDPRQRGEPAVELDQAADVLRVAFAEIGPDLVVDRLEGGHRALRSARGSGGAAGAADRRWCRSRSAAGMAETFQSSSSTCPSGALTQVRTVCPGSPCSSPVRRSRTCPACSFPLQVWQIPSRQPKGSSAPARSPPTRIDTPTSHVALLVGDAEADRAAGPDIGIAAADDRLKALGEQPRRGRPRPSSGPPSRPSGRGGRT